LRSSLKNPNNKKENKKVEISILLVEYSNYMNDTTFTPEEESILRENLKRCSEQTVEAAVSFRKTKNPELIAPIVIGILERFAAPEKRDLLKNPSDDMVLSTELELDSLTMVEIVLAVEEAINTSIDNEEIQNLRTLGDIKAFIVQKIGA